ncbi:MAG: NDP-sugar synthase [Myxococcales bacterium]|nr:NDP-sugar synthase [Myxococcales bacterium]
MIVAAGLGTRLRPLTQLLPKPALPVRGVPLIAYQLALLRAHGVTEVVINTHHLPERLEAAAQRFCPAGLALRFSFEREILGTGGAIRRVVDFLRESDPCLILGSDMLLDADLSALVCMHRERGDAITLLLRDDPRAAQFGSIGVDATGALRRIAARCDLGGETRSGLYTWANVVSARAFEALPKQQAFCHLGAWIAPMLAAGARDVRGALDLPCSWEPVGTLVEYLTANLAPPQLSYLDPAQLSPATRVEGDVVIGAGATIGAGASLQRVVVWEDERVPAGLRARDGVFAGGALHRVDGAGASGAETDRRPEPA